MRHVLWLAMLVGAFACPSLQARVVDHAANGFTLENSEWVPGRPADQLEVVSQ